MTDGVEPAAPAPPQEPKPNPFSRIAGVFFAPGETFASIVRRPDFVVPLVLILVVSLVTGILVAEKVDFKALAREAVENASRPGASPEFQQRQINMMGGVMKASAFLAPFITVVSMVILAAVVFAAFKIFGGEGDFLQAFSITVYAWMPNLIRAIVSVVAIMAKKSISMYSLQNPVASNPGYFVNAKLHPILAAFLGSFDVFTIWVVILMIIGFAAMSRFSRAKATAIMLSLFAIKVLFAVGGGALQALQMRMK